MVRHCSRATGTQLRPFSLSITLIIAALAMLTSRIASGQQPSAGAVRFHITDDGIGTFAEAVRPGEALAEVQQASLLQPASPLLPPARAEPAVPLEGPASDFARRLAGGAPGAELAPGQLALRELETSTTVLGAEARGRVTSDAGSLLFKSPAATSTGIQRRNPIINDPRVRGSRVGSLAASGSYWVPARIDLDTTLSKIDSRLVQQMTVVPGPYNVLNGPGLQSIQFDLLPTPRYADGSELHGNTSFDYFGNGQQMYGRQDIWGGGPAGGFRVGIGQRTGNDYRSGNGTDIPSSYNSRDINFSIGRDLSPDSHVEFIYLRLDQKNVELPGQAFDIDFLASDAYEVNYLLQNQVYFDQLAATAWYNDTRLHGSAQSPGKRREFPIMNSINFNGFTDVDTNSSGYRVASSWFADRGEQLVVGTDLRFINQLLNEITSAGGFQGSIAGWTTANSPIPDSSWVNPGLFAQYISPTTGGWQTTVGTRSDVVGTAIDDDQAKLTSVGTMHLPYASVVGTNVQDRTFGLWAAYVSSRYQTDNGWSLTLAAGHAERAPNLTELYVAQSFMFLLQNGLNTVTGDPRLAPEQLTQLDIVLAYQGERFVAQARGFQSWIHNYITFENLGVATGPPRNGVEQINLKYVNTDLATLTGTELLGSYRWTDMLTPFANLQYVQGEDQTRNGHFATTEATAGSPSMRDPTKPRGFFSGVMGGAKEPLPQIVPLQSRVGLQIHQAGLNPNWTFEIAARMVAPQNRVAVSLLEQPTAGFAVGDLRAYWRPTMYWTVLGGIENFTDRNYREHLDFRHQPKSPGLSMLQPGLNAYTSIQWMY